MATSWLQQWKRFTRVKTVLRVELRKSLTWGRLRQTMTCDGEISRTFTEPGLIWHRGHR